jgi:dehydrogenase/reductase SDR family protein 7B
VALALRDARHVLVTGAAGAIGSALAERARRAAPSARMTLVDRDRERLAVVAERLHADAAIWDLSNPDALDALWSEATAAGPVDVLVNCAGIMELRTFAGTSWRLGGNLVAVDLVSPLRLMSLAIPGMRERGAGIVVNVASMAGLVPLRGASYYGAAKAGLAMASEIARIELAGSGVHVLTVYPGPVTSGLERHARAQVEGSWLARWIPTGEPEALTDRVVAAIDREQARVVYPPLYALAAGALGASRFVTERFSPQPVD